MYNGDNLLFLDLLTKLRSIFSQCVLESCVTTVYVSIFWLLVRYKKRIILHNTDIGHLKVFWYGNENVLRVLNLI